MSSKARTPLDRFRRIVEDTPDLVAVVLNLVEDSLAELRQRLQFLDVSPALEDFGTSGLVIHVVVRS